MQRIARYFTEYFIAKDIISEEEREIYEYGFDITIFTFLSTLGFLLLGALLHHFWYAAIILVIFSLLQTNGGGYHANTHLKCFLTMVIILLIALGISYLPLFPYVAETASIVSIILLLVFPLTLHFNKAYLASQAPQLRRQSRLVTVLITGISAVLVYVVHLPIIPFALALTMSAISRLYATWERRKSQA